MYKIEAFVPEFAFDDIRFALLAIDVGRIGKYKGCLTRSQVTGIWYSDEGSSPTIGRIGEWLEEPEIKIEINVQDNLLEKAISVIRKNHPYEEPVINYWKINSVEKKG